MKKTLRAPDAVWITVEVMVGEHELVAAVREAVRRENHERLQDV